MFMIDMALDTHAFVKTLTAAGMPEPQAEAVTTLVTAAHEASTARFATKADLVDLATKSDVAAVRSELVAVKSDIGTLTGDIAALRAGVATLTGDVGALKSGVT